jgi:release factor glutamine methyltransferase
MQEEAKTWTLSDILNVTVDYLAKKNPNSQARLDSELLLARVMGLTRVSLYVNFEKTLNKAQVDAYRDLVRRRSQHEPVAYILGEKEFYKIPFKVDKRALIPRPETEHLVDEALSILKSSQNPKPKVLDLGCGCGTIALTLAKELPEILIEASDISQEALDLAKENAKALNLDSRIKFHLGDLFNAPIETQKFDLICANLPYVPTEDMENLPPDIFHFEPHSALDGGEKGLDLYMRLLTEAKGRLNPNGHILLEIHPFQYDPLKELADTLGLTTLEAVKDFSKKDRVFIARLSS